MLRSTKMTLEDDTGSAWEESMLKKQNKDKAKSVAADGDGKPTSSTVVNSNDISDDDEEDDHEDVIRELSILQLTSYGRCALDEILMIDQV